VNDFFCLKTVGRNVYVDNVYEDFTVVSEPRSFQPEGVCGFMRQGDREYLTYRSRIKCEEYL
jgi:hypothetical protein